jgi:hypothetical protein
MLEAEDLGIPASGSHYTVCFLLMCISDLGHSSCVKVNAKVSASRLTYVACHTQSDVHTENKVNIHP